MCKKILNLLNSENVNNIFLLFSPPNQQESSNKNKKPPTTKQEICNRKQETSNKNKKPPTENHETSNNFPELICGRIWARFPNRGRSRETKCKRIWSCFRFVSSVLYFFQNASHIVTSNIKPRNLQQKTIKSSNNFHELICGQICARFPNRGRSRETKCRAIRGCFRFGCTVLSFF